MQPKKSTRSFDIRKLCVQLMLTASTVHVNQIEGLNEVASIRDLRRKVGARVEFGHSVVLVPLLHLVPGVHWRFLSPARVIASKKSSPVSTHTMRSVHLVALGQILLDSSYF